MASQFAVPANWMIGKTIKMNSCDYPGCAYDATRRKGFQTKIVDAGTMTGNPERINVITDCGVHFSIDQFDDWKIVSE